MQNDFQPAKKLHKKIGILILVGLLIFCAVIIVNMVRYSKMGKLTITAAPDDITLVIGKKQVKTNRTIYVTPGTYTWKATRADFSSKTGSVSIKKGEAKDFDVYLQPSNSKGDDWLRLHPEQGYKIESQVGRRFEELGEEALKQTPLIGSLPFTAPGEAFRIDYGNTTVNGKPKTTIYIDVTGDQAKLDALDWIKSEGVDPATLTIEYTVVAPPETSNEDRW